MLNKERPIINNITLYGGTERTPVFSVQRRISKEVESKKERERVSTGQLRNLGLKPGDLTYGMRVFELGCGDASLLEALLEKGVRAYGVDFESVIEGNKKRLPSEYHKNLFAANFAEKNLVLPEEIKNQKFKYVIAHSVLQPPYTEKDSIEPLRTQLENMLGLINGDGEIRIGPVYPLKNFKDFLERPELGELRDEMECFFGDIDKPDDTYDLYKEFLLIKKKNGVHKGNYNRW